MVGKNGTIQYFTTIDLISTVCLELNVGMFRINDGYF